MSERMRYLGVLGLLCECSVHVDEDTRESIQSALEDACADGRLRWTRTLDRYDIEAVPGAPIATPSNRILELELEVKRLRSLVGECLYTGSMTLPQLNRLEIKLNEALSTPPPALAEAYVRLRDAAKCQLSGWPDHFHHDGPNLETALAEIARLEKGE